MVELERIAEGRETGIGAGGREMVRYHRLKLQVILDNLDRVGRQALPFHSLLFFLSLMMTASRLKTCPYDSRQSQYETAGEACLNAH